MLDSLRMLIICLRREILILKMFIMKKKLIAIIIAVVVVAAAVIGAVISIKQSAQAMEISTEEAQKLLNETFDEMAKTKPLKAIAEANSIEVKDLPMTVIPDAAVAPIPATIGMGGAPF